MEHHVQARSFLVQPARKHPAELAVVALHVDLHERAGIGLLLPRCGSLARAQPHHDVADAHRSAGLQRHVARHAVALVEHAQHRDPFAHRRRPERRVRAARHIDGGDVGLHRLLVQRGPDRRLVLDRNGGLMLPPLLVSEPPARAEAGDQRRHAQPAAQVHASGVQAS
ncbi:hypothetical protein ASG11_14290 [Sphingomonas sp. Leaf357]|nr:hypothetical protein ASG11_14290 [Sphingomonas sp. Leaf357]